MKSPLAHLPIVARRDHPHLRNHIDHLIRSGQLTPLLHGVSCWADQEPDFFLLVRAAVSWNPRAILVGATAAALTWWPELKPDRVELASPPPRNPPPWIRCRRLRIPASLTEELGDTRVVTPELSVLGMLDGGDANPMCEALRRGVTTVARIRTTLEQIPRASGNLVRNVLLSAARDNPWSPLELEAHQRLRRAGLKGWRTNHRVLLDGLAHFLDIAFPGARLALEMDGWQHHGNHLGFVADRIRQNRLVLGGWTILRFTTQSLDRLVPETKRALARLR